MTERLYPCSCNNVYASSSGDEYGCSLCGGLGYRNEKQTIDVDQTMPKDVHYNTEFVWSVCCALARLLSELSSKTHQIADDVNKLRYERDRERAATDQFWSSQFEQSRSLREEVKSIARQMGASPEPQQRSDRRRSQQDGDLVAAVQRMVRAEVRATTDDVMSIENVQNMVRTLLDQNAREIVRKAMGLGDSYGSQLSGPLAEKVKEAVRPAINASFAGVQAEIDRLCVAPPEFDEEIRDVFVREYRQRVLRYAGQEAERIAQQVMVEQARKVILEELPWLKKYIVLERLSAPNTEEQT